MPRRKFETVSTEHVGVERTHDIVDRIENPGLVDEVSKRKLAATSQCVLRRRHDKKAIRTDHLDIDVLIQDRSENLSQHEVDVSVAELAEFLLASLRRHDVNDQPRVQP